MTTDVINGVPRELRSVLSMILSALDRDAAEGKTVRGEMAEELRALLATAQPVSDDRYPPCDYCEKPLSYHPWHGSGVINGIESRHIHACDDCRDKLPKPVSAGGEREAQESADEAFRAWERDGNPISGANGYMAAKAGFRAGAEWQARAAQPQQAVAVTDEVRRLREALGEAVEYLDSTPFNEIGAGSILHRTMRDALSAHKTGEEE